MKLIVGLGNPGEKYQDTRHNIGFMVVEKLAKELGQGQKAWQKDKSDRSLQIKIGDVIIAKPMVYMNRSGEAVKALMDFYKLTTIDTWIIHDDIDLPLGKIRIRMGGASAGHNGINSIIATLKTDNFLRFRLGVGRGKESTGLNADKNLRHRSVISFVLSRFHTNEAGEFRHLIERGKEAVRIALIDGIDKAMNRFN